MNADIVVVGGGPAGAATALLLARAGHDVLIIDRQAFPRAKPCGDCLSPGATPLLDRLGVRAAIEAAPHARLDRWRIAGPRGEHFEAAFANGTAPPPAWSVERAILDHHLLEAAISAGARFHRATVTDVLRSARGAVAGVAVRGSRVRARVVVGADGLRSIVAARLGVRPAPTGLRKVSMTWHIDMPSDRCTGEMHVGDGICAGIAPVSADGARTNLTLVADATRFGRDIATDRLAFAAAALESLPLLRGRIPHPALREPALMSGPFDRPVRRVTFDGAVLAGDAAGYYDPFTGQGVYQALASAFLLTPIIDRALRNGRIDAAALRPWAAVRARLLRLPHLVQRGIELVLSRPVLARHAIARIARAPAFAHALVAVTGDVEPPSSLLSIRALSSLLTPPSNPEDVA